MVKFEEPNRKSTIVHGEAELKPWSLKHGDLVEKKTASRNQIHVCF